MEVDLTGPTPIVDGTPMDAELGAGQGSPLRHMLAGSRSVRLVAQPGDRRGRWHLGIGAERVVADAIDERTRAIREMTGAQDDAAERTIVAPMPGLVMRVEVAVGDTVRAGQGVVVVEAMKMENELKAPADGVVAEVVAVPGATVEKGAVLIVLE